MKSYNFKVLLWTYAFPCRRQHTGLLGGRHGVALVIQLGAWWKACVTVTAGIADTTSGDP